MWSNCAYLFCWNHSKQDFKFCLQKNNAQSKEISVFVQDLFQGRVDEELSQSDVNYFNTHLKSYISGHAAKLVSQHSGTY